jgi:hypothetical protein
MKSFRLDPRIGSAFTPFALHLSSFDMNGALSRIKPSGNYARAVVVMLLGLALGLGATALSLRSGYGFAPLRIGPWVAWPRIGVTEIDPYARAALAKRGEAPLGRDQGLAFVATTDSAGEPLDGHCEYKISDPLPTARYWTLGIAAPDGRVLDNIAQRVAFTSSTVLRREGGVFDIVIAREARPGNWLSPGEARDFIAILRLYDAPFDIEAHHGVASFPQIVKLGCA